MEDELKYIKPEEIPDDIEELLDAGSYGEIMLNDSDLYELLYAHGMIRSGMSRRSACVTANGWENKPYIEVACKLTGMTEDEYNEYMENYLSDKRTKELFRLAEELGYTLTKITEK